MEIAGHACGSSTFTVSGSGQLDGAAPVPLSSKILPLSGASTLSIGNGDPYCMLFSSPTYFNFIVDMTHQTVNVQMGGAGTFAAPAVPPSTSTTAAAANLDDLVLSGTAEQLTGPVVENCAMRRRFLPRKSSKEAQGAASAVAAGFLPRI